MIPLQSPNGLGKSKVLDTTPLKRKSINKLIDYTNQLDNNKLMEINKNTPVSNGKGIFVPSEDF